MIYLAVRLVLMIGKREKHNFREEAAAEDPQARLLLLWPRITERKPERDYERISQKEAPKGRASY